MTGRSASCRYSLRTQWLMKFCRERFLSSCSCRRICSVMSVAISVLTCLPLNSQMLSLSMKWRLTSGL